MEDIMELKSQTRVYKVYHIREKGCNNLNEGYIGITKNSLAFRLLQHSTSKRPVGIKLRELGMSSVEIVEVSRGTKEYALNLEYTLRPKMHLGWNMRAGGNVPTVCCPGCNTYLPKRKTGSYCEQCNPCKFGEGHTPHNYGCGEQYILTSPEGIEYRPLAFTVFCRDHNLTAQNLRKVAKGLRKNHKGWIATKA